MLRLILVAFAVIIHRCTDRMHKLHAHLLRFDSMLYSHLVQCDVSSPSVPATTISKLHEINISPIAFACYRARMLQSLP